MIDTYESLVPGASQDSPGWEDATFLARLTGVYVLTDSDVEPTGNYPGMVAGTNLYIFAEQATDPSTGIPTDACPGRQTVISSGYPLAAYAIESGNLSVTVPAPQPPTTPAASLASGGTLTVSQAYYYVITALGGYGETLPSAEVTVTPTSGNQTASLSWVSGPSVNSFNIYRGTTAGGENLLIGTVNAATTTFSDTGFSGTSQTPPTVAGTTGPFVEMRFRSAIGGAPVYEFQAPTDGFTGTLGASSPPSPPAPVVIENWNYQYTNDTFVYTNSPTTYDTNSPIVYNGTPITFFLDSTWTIDAGVIWAILGADPTTSTLEFNNFQLNLLNLQLNNIGQIVWNAPVGKPLQFIGGNPGLLLPGLPFIQMQVGNLGDLPFLGAGAQLQGLAGNTATTLGFLTQTGTGSASQAPAWTPITSSSLQFTTTSPGTVPAPTATNGYFLKDNGSWAEVADGTVTSVAMTGDGTVFQSSVSGSPVTGSGTLAPALVNQPINKVFAGPTSGPNAAPTFRALVPADYPAFVASGSSHAGGAVPDPGATAGTTKYLREDATWDVPPGSGTPGGTGDGSGGVGNATANCQKFTVSYTQLLGLSVPGSLTLGALPANSIVLSTILQINTQFTTSSGSVNGITIYATGSRSQGYTAGSANQTLPYPAGDVSIMYQAPLGVGSAVVGFDANAIFAWSGDGSLAYLTAGQFTIWFYYLTLS